jgi:hypothetical protein
MSAIDCAVTNELRAAVTDAPGAHYAGITLVTGKEFTTPRGSGELVERLEAAGDL